YAAESGPHRGPNAEIDGMHRAIAKHDHALCVNRAETEPLVLRLRFSIYWQGSSDGPRVPKSIGETNGVVVPAVTIPLVVIGHAPGLVVNISLAEQEGIGNAVCDVRQLTDTATANSGGDNGSVKRV